MILLMQEYGNYNKRLTHQNSIDYEILRHIPPEYQDSMTFDKNQFVFSWMLSNPEFVLEMKRLISRNELSLEYIKSARYALLWLIKLFDIKWRQLHGDLDYISRLRLLNLQKQAKFILDNLVANNQRQHKKPEDNKYILEDKSDIISNTEKIEVEEGILIEHNRGNLNETNKAEISRNKSWKNIPTDYITSTEETRVMNYSELLKRIKDNSMKDKNPTTVIQINKKLHMSTDDNSIINDTFVFKTLGDKNLIKNETSSESNKFTSTLQDNHTKDHGKRFSQLENVSSISPSENAIDTLQETDQPVGTAIMHGSLKNITDILKTRRTLDVLVPSNKNEEYNQKSGDILTRNIDKHHYFNQKMEIQDNASAIDEILEAVDEVLPTDKSVEVSPKGTETISRML